MINPYVKTVVDTDRNESEPSGPSGTCLGLSYAIGITRPQESIVHNEIVSLDKIFDPLDADQVVWRYIPYPWFEDMVKHNVLSFNALIKMNDVFEGKPWDGECDIVDWSNTQFSTGLGQETTYDFQSMVYVSSWTMNSNEQAVLWSKFAPLGVAIKSTIGKLKKSILGANLGAIIDGPSVCLRNDRKIHFGRIRYSSLPYTHSELVPSKHAFNYFTFALRKRAKYRFENEVRLVIGDAVASCLGTTPRIGIQVVLPAMIDEIIMSPCGDSNLLERVQKCSLGIKVSRSSIPFKRVLDFIDL